MVLLNKEEIKNVIPHREPFLLIDEIVALTPGEKCVAKTYTKETDFWFGGHFPGHPVTPGVLIVEMLAQTGAVCIGTMDEYKGKIAFFSKIDKVKFRRQLLPNETLTLEMEMIKLRSNAGVGKGTAKVGTETVCTGELTFMFADVTLEE